MARSIKAQKTDTISVRVPIAFRRRGGRKVVMMPEGATAPQSRPHANDATIRALARAFRWKRLLDSRALLTVTGLAAQEGIAVSYLTRMLRLTQLAPDLVEAILDARHPPSLTLQSLRAQIPDEWSRQRESWLPGPGQDWRHPSEPLSGERAANQRIDASI